MHKANSGNGHSTHLHTYLTALTTDLQTLSTLAASSQEGSLMMQRHARNLVDRLAIAFIASLYVQYSSLSPQYAAAADGWISTRIFKSNDYDMSGSGLAGLNYGSNAVFTKEQATLIMEGHLPQFH